MISQLETSDEVLHEAAEWLEAGIARMDECLQSATPGPTTRRLERSARGVHRKHEHLKKALESDDRERVLKSYVRLLEAIRCFYRILGS